MKIFVWNDVLADCTSGMIVALAPDLETAVATVLDRAEQWERDTLARDMDRETPTVHEVDEPSSWHVWGGS